MADAQIAQMGPEGTGGATAMLTPQMDPESGGAALAPKKPAVVKAAKPAPAAPMDITPRSSGATDAREMVLRPPTFPKPSSPPQQQEQSPLKNWGSAAFIFSMLASALTRRPMITALNAGAAAMNAFKQNDKEAADRAFAEWKEANQQARDLATYQFDLYKEQMSHVEHEENLGIQRDELKLRETEAKLRATSAALQDPAMTAALNHGGLDEAVKLQKDRERNQKDLKEAEDAVKPGYEAHRAIMDMEQTDEYKQASTAQKIKMRADIIMEFNPRQASSQFNQPLDPQTQKILGGEMAKYNMAPPTPQQISRYSSARELVLEAIRQNPNYVPGDYVHVQEAKKALLGPDGNAIASFVTLKQHLETIDKLITDLPGASQEKIGNAIANAIANQTGDPSITSFQAAQNLVANEIVKAISGATGGGVEDRQRALALLDPSLSPEQLKGNIQVIKDLIRGQVVSKVNKFSNYLKPEQVLPPGVMSFYGFKPSGAPIEEAPAAAPAAAAAPTAGGPAGWTKKATGPDGKTAYLVNGQWVLEDGSPAGAK